MKTKILKDLIFKKKIYKKKIWKELYMQLNYVEKIFNEVDAIIKTLEFWCHFTFPYNFSLNVYESFLISFDGRQALTSNLAEIDHSLLKIGWFFNF